MEVSHRRKNEILSFVKTILELKKQDISADTSRLEREIGRLVYELKEEEIKVAEGSVERLLTTGDKFCLSFVHSNPSSVC